MLLLCWALMVVTLSGSAVRAEFGKSGWPIFRKVQSAQFRGISASAPDCANLSGILYNPAIGGLFENRELLIVSERGLSEDTLGAVVYGIPAGAWMFAFGAAYYDAGSIELNWFENNEIQTESVSLQRDMMGTATIERKLSDTVFAGLSLKGATSELAQRVRASAYAADLGLYVRPFPFWSISLACQNIGTASKFVDHANLLPTAGYLGTALMWKSPAQTCYVITQAGASYYTVDQKLVPEAGCEIGCGPVSVNAGFRSGVEEGNMHVGTEFCVGSMVFGYAYSPSTYLDSMHRVTVAWRFAPASAVEKPKEAEASIPVVAPPAEPVVKPAVKPPLKPKAPIRQSPKPAVKPVLPNPAEAGAVPAKAAPAKVTPAVTAPAPAKTLPEAPQQQKPKRKISDFEQQNKSW